jgi:hypothetical protein
LVAPFSFRKSQVFGRFLPALPFAFSCAAFIKGSRASNWLKAILKIYWFGTTGILRHCLRWQLSQTYSLLQDTIYLGGWWKLRADDFWWLRVYFSRQPGQGTKIRIDVFSEMFGNQLEVVHKAINWLSKKLNNQNLVRASSTFLKAGKSWVMWS